MFNRRRPLLRAARSAARVYRGKHVAAVDRSRPSGDDQNARLADSQQQAVPAPAAPARLRRYPISWTARDPA